VSVKRLAFQALRFVGLYPDQGQGGYPAIQSAAVAMRNRTARVVPFLATDLYDLVGIQLIYCIFYLFMH